ncbi:hypothetical protein [Paracoccus homiensis]|uniref:DUF3329 domain-containing protein n=1 Tax=Paracoccus homiensis TaxID=364199 RepID=A0A1H9YVY8_9RHOB|nr:hypothetical protein SAMN04489858_101328 [Paracoccus homiensis]
MIDPNAPFFRPLWVRLICGLSPLLWAGVEAWHGNGFWALLFAAAGLYLCYQLFFLRKAD